MKVADHIAPRRLFNVALLMLIAALLSAQPALADDKPQRADPKLVAQAIAEWNAIPDKSLAPAVADALAAEANFPNPTFGTLVFGMPQQVPWLRRHREGDPRSTFSWTERATLSPGPSGSVQIKVWQCFRDSVQWGVLYNDDLPKDGGFAVGDDGGCRDDIILTDKTGLIPLYIGGFINVGGDHINVLSSARKASFLALHLDGSARPDVSPLSDFDFTEIQASEHNQNVSQFDNKIEYHCKYEINGDGVGRNCTINMLFQKDSDKKYYLKNDNSPFSTHFIRNTALNYYLADSGEICLAVTCFNGHYSHKIVDWKTDGDWHSKSVSAALSPADREKANALFASGFDSYKSGDFGGAAALLTRGLEIDPANYRAYFTLAEIARSQHVKDPDDLWAFHVALYDYQRVVELGPPDTPEVIKSGVHLTAHSID